MFWPNWVRDDRPRWYCHLHFLQLNINTRNVRLAFLFSFLFFFLLYLSILFLLFPTSLFFAFCLTHLAYLVIKWHNLQPGCEALTKKAAKSHLVADMSLPSLGLLIRWYTVPIFLGVSLKESAPEREKLYFCSSFHCSLVYAFYFVF